MTNLTLGIYFADENDNVCSKRQIGTNWQVNANQYLLGDHAADVEDEISKILVENLKLQITPEVVKEMLDEIKRSE